MESVIKWQTGEPKEEGAYLVTIKVFAEKIIYQQFEKIG